MTRSGSSWCSPRRARPSRPRLTYDQALEEALCHGWIDGQVRRRDERTYRQRFTPRRARSQWSERNVGIVERLLGEGRMRTGGPGRGRARQGRRALGGRLSGAEGRSRCPTISRERWPPSRGRSANFELLSSQNRYAVLYRIHSAKRESTRARRIEDFVAMLARGETPHPQKRPLAG